MKSIDDVVDWLLHDQGPELHGTLVVERTRGGAIYRWLFNSYTNSWRFCGDERAIITDYVDLWLQPSSAPTDLQGFESIFVEFDSFGSEIVS